VLVALAVGVAVGVLTSFLQTHLEFPWLALVNAASPWLTTAFVAGALQSRLPTAMVVGLAATTLEVVAYYVTSDLRGFDVSMGSATMWSLCAVVGGPIFGAAGHVWWRATPAGLGAALMVAAYASEAVVAYHFRLGYSSTALLFGVVALLLAVGLGRHRSQYPALARWLLPTFLAGAAGQSPWAWLSGDTPTIGVVSDLGPRRNPDSHVLIWPRCERSVAAVPGRLPLPQRNERQCQLCVIRSWATWTTRL